MGRGLTKPGIAGLADNPLLLCFKKCMNFFVTMGNQFNSLAPPYRVSAGSGPLCRTPPTRQSVRRKEFHQ